jgi:hypothetical protein
MLRTVRHGGGREGWDRMRRRDLLYLSAREEIHVFEYYYFIYRLRRRSSSCRGAVANVNHKRCSLRCPAMYLINQRVSEEA